MFRPRVKNWSWKLFWYMVRHPFLSVSAALEITREIESMRKEGEK